MFKYISKASNLLPPEIAHSMFLNFLKYEFYNNKFKDDSLKIELWGKKFENPIGLAAGFDKNAEVINGCLKMGFGFVEVGTVTPRPQNGNPKPRVFKIPEHSAVIQRLGFNNKGIENFLINVLQYRKSGGKGLVGINIGKNKDTENYISDYVSLVENCSNYFDYIVVNVSSPNTAGLREIQKKDKLNSLLKILSDKNKYSIPLLVKISPDINKEDLQNICQVSLNEQWINGLIVSNTTISRKSLKNKPLLNSWKIREEGGLSGPPLFEQSNLILRETYKLTNGKIPIIGVGGILTAEDAFEKISLGASLIQIYTALIYEGPAVVLKILKGVNEILISKGFSNIKAAIGHKVL